MAVTFSTLFTRLGKLMGLTSTVRTSATNLRSEYADVAGAYAAATMDFIGNLSNQIERRINDNKRVTFEAIKSAEKTLIEMMDDDLSSSNGSGLSAKTTERALRDLILQMEAGSSSVDGTTITINTVAAGSSNQGNGKFVLSGLASQINAPDVVDHPSIKTELISAECTEDLNGRVAENSERFRVFGQRAIDRADEDWPRGSGTSFFLSAANPNVQQGTRAGANVLMNSNFESFTSNAPDNWTITAGVAGSSISSSDETFTGSTCLKLTSTGSNNPEINQSFNSSTGTLGRLEPDTLYTLSFAIKRSGTSPSAGNILIRAWDGSNTLNNSDSNRKMEVSLAHNNVLIGTSYSLVTLACMTPRILPKGIKFQIKLDTSFTSGTSLHIDHLCLAKMHRPIAGGLGYQIIPGSTPFAFQDTFTCQIVNNGEGAFNTEFDRFFPQMETLGYALPPHYGGSETINDNLIS